MKFLDVKTDLAFKKVFGSEDSKPVLMSFLNAILYQDKAQQIDDLVIVDPYTIPMLQGMKDTYVDVKARLNDGTQVIIEMQVLNHQGFEKRVLYNAAKNYSVQLQKGDDYTLLNPVIALSIVDFTMFDDSDAVISRFKMFDKQHMIDYSDDIEMVFVELPKFTQGFDALHGILDQWIYFLIHAGMMDYIPDSFAQPVATALSLIDESVMSQAELEAQHKRKEFIFIQKSSLELAKEQGLTQGLTQGRSEGIEQGLAQGRSEGIEQGFHEGAEKKEEEMAKKMIEANLPDETIIQITGLNPEQLDAFKQLE